MYKRQAQIYFLEEDIGKNEIIPKISQLKFETITTKHDICN